MQRFELSKIVLYCAIMACSVCWHNNQATALSFESPFPPCAFKNMLDISLHIAGDLMSLQDTNYCSYDRCVLQDAIAGRIMRLQESAVRFCKDYESGHLYIAEDIEYVTSVVSRGIELYARSVHNGPALASVLFNDVKNRLENLME